MDVTTQHGQFQVNVCLAIGYKNIDMVERSYTKLSIDKNQSDEHINKMANLLNTAGSALLEAMQCHEEIMNR